jgi:hypothetical protein
MAEGTILQHSITPSHCSRKLRVKTLEKLCEHTNVREAATTREVSND